MHVVVPWARTPMTDLDGSSTSMPSPEHDLLVGLFKDPKLIESFAHTVLGLSPAGGYTNVSAVPGEISAPVIEFRADNVLVFYNDKRAVQVFVVDTELDSKNKAGKLRAWPVYVTVARAQHRCDNVHLLVITPSERVERWAREDIVFGPGHKIVTKIVRARDLPIITDDATASQYPQLALLSAALHILEASKKALTVEATSRARELAAQLTLAEGLMEQLQLADRDVYFKTLERALPQQAYEVFTVMAQEHPGPIVSRTEARAHEKGRAEGREEGEIYMVLRALQKRFSVEMQTRREEVVARIRRANQEQRLAVIELVSQGVPTLTDALRPLPDLDQQN